MQEIKFVNELVQVNKLVGEEGIIINEGNAFFISGINQEEPASVKKACKLAYLITTGHIFLNGNKRTAFVIFMKQLHLSGHSVFLLKEINVLFEYILNAMATDNMTDKGFFNLIKEIIETAPKTDVPYNQIIFIWSDLIKELKNETFANLQKK
jgi:hypothetical protein